MEFEIDFAMVRDITSRECEQARAEIAELGPVAAYRHSCERHDERVAAAGDAGTLACKAGCYWCCYFSVDVRAVEVLNILEHVDETFTQKEKLRVRGEIEANSKLLGVLSEEERARRNLKCPFLAAGRCTIYSVRPQTCRNYHATDARGCQKSFEEPDNLDIDPDFAPLVYQAGGAHVDAFSVAMRDAGFDISVYELNCAFAAALADPMATQERFASKRKAFATLAGTEAPLEFMDENE